MRAGPARPLATEWQLGSPARAASLPTDLANKLSITDRAQHQLVDVFTGEPVGERRSGADLRWPSPVEMDADTRLQWLRLETCG